MKKMLKKHPLLTKFSIYTLFILCSCLIYLLVSDHAFILRGSALLDYNFISKQFLRAILNYLCLCIYVGVCLGAILFVLYKGCQALLHLIQSIRRQTFPVKQVLLHAAISAGILGISFLLAFLTGRFDCYHILFFAGTLFIVYFLFLYARKAIKKFETLFLLICLTAGTIFCFGMPLTTNVSWDDQIHFQNVATLSYPTTVDYSEAEYDLMTLVYPVTFDRAEIADNLSQLNAGTQSHGLTYEKDYPFLYQYIAYFPAACVLGICRIAGIPATVTFLLGRFINLIIYAVICFFAIRRLQWGKMILGVIALFPTNIFLASNYSYDYWVTSFTFLAMAYLLAELQTPDTKIAKRNLIILLGAFVLGFAPKAIYFPLILLCLLLPAEKFQNPEKYRKYRRIVLGICLFLIISFVIPFLFGGAGADDTRGGSDVNSGLQIRYILTHPIAYTKTLLGFLFGSFLTFQTSMQYTNFLAYLGTNTQGVLSMVLLAVAVIMDHQSEDTRILTLRNRIWLYLLAFISMALVATALYVSFTPVGYKTVMGCSPRYIIPIVFPIAYSLGSARIRVEGSKRLYALTFLTISAYILLHTSYTLFISLYV